MCDNYDDEGFVVRIRGLPWSATDKEIIHFLDDISIINGERGIHRTFTREGRPSGEAYIELPNERDFQNALKKDHQMMGRRYIEVFESSRKEMDYVLQRSGAESAEQDVGDGVVRCRGLPFQCTKEEIAQFFSGLEIVPHGITIPSSGGRSTGEAFVQFSSQSIADQALSKHKHKIGHRYIEIFKSTVAEIREATGGGPKMGRPRPGPYDRPMRGGGRGRGGRGGRMVGGYGSYGGRGDYSDNRYRGDYGNGGGGNYGPRGGSMKGYGRDQYGGRSYGVSGYDIENNDDLEYTVHMRGLPFRASKQDISNFFSPVIPVGIFMEYGNDGRLNGEADITFASYEDARMAMKKDRGTMQHRYIELFARFEENEEGGDYEGAGGYGMGYGATSGVGYDDGDYSGMGMRGSNYKQF